MRAEALVATSELDLKIRGDVKIVNVFAEGGGSSWD